jgi:hypothetical protein
MANELAGKKVAIVATVSNKANWKSRWKRCAQPAPKRM